MGLPINKFICASNENNVLYDFINTGIYDKQRELKVTSSPSMDILISSNLERLLYDLCDNDASMVNGLIGELNKSGRYEINSKMKSKLGDFYGEFTTDSETIETIRGVFKDFNYLIDTHTAVGYDVYKKYIKATGDETKTVIASTASAFKFPESIIGAIDSKFRVSDKFALIERIAEIANKTIPKGIKDIGRRKILHNKVCKQEQMKSVISEILGL
jgi:threonine synthase